MKRDKSIDFLMFVAVLLVVNSHLESMYAVPFKALATGGIIGDALFFFCSGYKLSLGRLDRFDNWFKRRLVRIYPSVLVWDILAALVFSLPLTVGSLFDGWWFCGYWFIKCILIHYLALYLILRYFNRKMTLVLGLVCIGIGAWWCVSYSPKFAAEMLGALSFEWYYLFAFTLSGAILARCELLQVKLVPALACLVVSVLGHYGWLGLVDRFPALMPFRILMLFSLAAVVGSLYLLSKTDAVVRLMDRRVGLVMAAFGGLCLEVYISHNMIETTRFNHLFPLNVLFFFMAVFALAYLIRCATRLVVQTFDKNRRYDYREVFDF